MKAANYKLTIPGVMNPSFGGTGNFVLETRRNAAYLIDINLLDFNFAFATVGILKTPPELTGVTITSTSLAVNAAFDLTVGFTTTVPVPIGGKITIDIRSSIYKTLDTLEMTTALNADLSFSGLLFNLVLKAELPAGAAQVVIKNLMNPTYSGLPGQMTIRTWTPATNTLLNQKKSLNLPTLTAGPLAVTLSSHFRLGHNEVISINDLVEYQVRFTLSNYIESEGTIKLGWLSGGLSSGCIVYSGLYDQSEAKPVTCTVSGSDFIITSFKRV